MAARLCRLVVGGALSVIAAGVGVYPHYARRIGKACELDADTHAPICSLDPWVRPGSGAPQGVRTFEPYAAGSRPPPKGTRFDGNTTALVFLHISKSGGMTVREILGNVAKRRGLGEVQLVTARKEWRQVVEQCSDPKDRAANGLCNQALYSSTNGLGLCDFVNKPYCMYVTVLREPISRLLSSYNYFCTLGKEKGKGWQSGWTSCRYSEAQWATVMADHLSLQLGVSQAPVRRLSAAETSEQCAECPYLATAPKGVARDAVLAAAKKNLASGAVRPLFLDSLAKDLQRLAGELQLPELAEEAERSKPQNVHAHSKQAAQHAATLLQHSRALAGDLELYQHATTLKT